MLRDTFVSNTDRQNLLLNEPLNQILQDKEYVYRGEGPVIVRTKRPPHSCYDPDEFFATSILPGDSALHIAIKLGRWKEFSDLLSSGADVNAKNSKGETPLLLAMHEQWDHGDYNQAQQYTRELIKHPKVDLSLADNHGTTPLILLSKMMVCGNTYRINLLPTTLASEILNKDKNKQNEILTAQDNQGNTAFHYLAKKTTQEAFKLAENLSLNAPQSALKTFFSSRNNDGQTVLDVADDPTGKLYVLLDYYALRKSDPREYYTTFYFFGKEYHQGYSRTDKLAAVKALLDFYSIGNNRRTLQNIQELKRYENCLADGNLGKIYSNYFKDEIEKMTNDLMEKKQLQENRQKLKQELNCIDKRIARGYR